MQNSFQIWVNAVCQEVRFRPDHRSIEEELRTHYEDHVKDLLRLGRPRELAEQRALEAMGSAQEVGWALDKVHKPWLGWLWEASRVLVLLLALLLAWKVWNWNYDSRRLWETTWDQLAWNLPARGVSHAATGYLDLWLAPGEPEPYRDPLEEAPAPGETRLQVPLTLWVETKDVYHTHLQGLYDGLEVTADGQPLAFGSYIDGNAVRTSGYWTYYGPGQRGWTRDRNGMLLVLDHPPRRVEVTHSRCGWTLTAEWEGAA